MPGPKARPIRPYGAAGGRATPNPSNSEASFSRPFLLRTLPKGTYIYFTYIISRDDEYFSLKRLNPWTAKTINKNQKIYRCLYNAPILITTRPKSVTP